MFDVKKNIQHNENISNIVCIRIKTVFHIQIGHTYTCNYVYGELNKDLLR